MNNAGQVKHADRAHAILSASGSDRWMNCTPSARLEEAYPEQTSDYAEEGTLAHEFAEQMLRHRTGSISAKDFNQRVSELKKHRLYYDGMMKEVEPYVTLVLEQMGLDKDPVLIIEHRSDFSSYVPDGFGTTDAAVIAKRILFITDLKFGKGIRVSAKDNPQLKLYALGALTAFDMLYDIDTVRLTISQPRLDAVSTWDITPEDLIKWGEEVVKPTAVIADKGEGDLKPGEWCKFCRAKVNCPALREEALTVARNDFEPADIATKVENGEDVLLSIYEAADRITDYLQAVKAYVLQRAIAGKKWKGLKLVAGKSNRTITDERTVRHILTNRKYKFEDFENVKLKGIGDLEKLLGKADFEKIVGPYVSKPPGKPILVEASDPRPEFSSADDFKDNADDLL